MTRYIFILLGTILCLSACRSSRQAQRTTSFTEGQTPLTHIEDEKSAEQAATAAYAASVAKVRANSLCLTASAKVQLSGLGKDLGVNGQLRMKRNEVIRLSLRFLGLEVGLMEFTPQYVLVIDRMNKRYVQAAYNEVSFLKKSGLDFNSLQALFWDELFVPGSNDPSREASRFTLTDSIGKRVLTLTDAPELLYTFVTNPDGPVVEQVRISGHHNAKSGYFNCTYSNFTPFAGRPFPTHIQLQGGTTTKQATLDLNLSNFKSDGNWNTHTTPSQKYKRMSLDEVVKGLHL